MFDKLWAWLMGVITYLTSLFGLNRVSVPEGSADAVAAVTSVAAPESAESQESAPSE